MRIVTIARPLMGGIYSMILSMRSALAKQGVTLTWVAAGKTLSKEILSTATADDLAFGSVVGFETDIDSEKAQALIEHIGQTGARIVVIHAFGGLMEMNVARYFPDNMRRILVVHSITPATFGAAKALRDWVHAAVGVSPRIAKDLVERCGYEASSTFTIPNGIDVANFKPSERARDNSGVLRVLSCGRIEHSSKGVLWIPDIIGHTLKNGARVSLTVAGDGPDLDRLKDRVVTLGLSGVIGFSGAVNRESLPELMANHDAFLFPSIYEGLGITLIEAMACGCVPVASRIRGVTDFVIQNERNGLLFDIGDCRRAGSSLAELYRESELLANLRRSAIVRAQDFDLEKFGKRYIELIQHVNDSPRKIRTPLSIADWRMPSQLRPGLRRLVPPSIKNRIRSIRERMN